jgi:hypothetical protein
MTMMHSPRITTTYEHHSNGKTIKVLINGQEWRKKFFTTLQLQGDAVDEWLDKAVDEFWDASAAEGAAE